MSKKKKLSPFSLLDGLLTKAKFQADAWESHGSVKQVERRKKARLKDRAKRFLRLQELQSDARRAAVGRLKRVDIERMLALTRQCLVQIDGWFPAYDADGQLTDDSECKYAESQELYRPAVEGLSRIADLLEPSPSTLPEESRARKRRGCPLKIQGKSVFVEGEQVPLDLTADRRDDAILFLEYLIGMNGDWISGPEINITEKDKAAKGRQGVRWDRIRKRLPDDIKKHIESNPKKGYRIKWPK